MKMSNLCIHMYVHALEYLIEHWNQSHIYIELYLDLASYPN